MPRVCASDRKYAVVGGECSHPAAAMALAALQPSVAVGTTAECFQRYVGIVAGVKVQRVLDRDLSCRGVAQHFRPSCVACHLLPWAGIPGGDHVF